jgi:hypothetical protein
MARALLALGILILVQQAGAATNELTTQLQKPKRYTITTIAQTESNLYETSAREHEAQGRLTVAPSYKYKNYRATLSVPLLQKFDHGNEGIMGNAKATVTHLPIELTQDTSLIQAAGGRLPTNVKDRHDSSFDGALLTETSILTNWNIKDVPFTTVYGLYLTKNFHDFTRSRFGKSNLSYSVVNYFGVEKYVTRKLSFLIDGDYTYARTYDNSMRTLFSIGQSATYEFSNDFSVTVGHSNGGDALQANGTDYDIQVFDANRSVVYANVRAVY